MELIDAAAIREGAVFVAGERMRRVIAVLQGHVRYSNGGDTNRTCQLRTFQRFATRAERGRV